MQTKKYVDTYTKTSTETHIQASINKQLHKPMHAKRHVHTETQTAPETALYLIVHIVQVQLLAKNSLDFLLDIIEQHRPSKHQDSIQTKPRKSQITKRYYRRLTSPDLEAASTQCTQTHVSKHTHAHTSSHFQHVQIPLSTPCIVVVCAGSHSLTTVLSLSTLQLTYQSELSAEVCLH